MGCPLVPPDLVMDDASPDIYENRNGGSPLSLEKTIPVNTPMCYSSHTSVTKYPKKSPTVKFSSVLQTFIKELSPDTSSENLPSIETEEKTPKDFLSAISINAGSMQEDMKIGGKNFLKDDCFIGGDIIETNAVIEDGGTGNTLLYRTAHSGNFSYCFRNLQPGDYFVHLHFAEIVFVNGPAGARVFDVLVQGKKVVSSLDIYAEVGANKPLVLSDILVPVDETGLCIKFEGVIGSPIVCGISVTKDSSASIKFSPLFKKGEIPLSSDSPLRNISHRDQGMNGGEMEDVYRELLRKYETQSVEMAEMRKMIDELREENKIKNDQCQDACKSLQELQTELMRKSMHVGSLAFAIEGQVKEKTKWFLLLRNLTEKLKLIKLEHQRLLDEAHAWKKSVPEVDGLCSMIQEKVNQQVFDNEYLRSKYIEAATERKALYNKVLELKGNIRVFCRCRPLNAEEVEGGASLAIDCSCAKDGELTVTSNGTTRKTFKFDAVFAPHVNQAEVFEETAPLAASVLDGYNVCIFAYGQTGTGKTFTMEGTETARGVNFRTLEEVFRLIKQREKLVQYRISVSAIEVYNEQIRDLLASNPPPSAASKRLEVKQAPEGLHHIPGLIEAQVSNIDDVWDVLQTGNRARAVGATSANEHSSRSHCIHCVTVKGECLVTGEHTRSKLWLVDLAGSERVTRSEVQGERLKETQNINRSLSALGDVIFALANKSPHVPYRNSKLTHLLQDSLGGDSKTLMFVQISPSSNDTGETLCSLNFASRVRGVEMGPAKKQLDNSEFLRYKQMGEKLKQELKNKGLQIKKLEETIHGYEMKVKEKDTKVKNLLDKMNALEFESSRRNLSEKPVETDDPQNTVLARPLGGNHILAHKKSLIEHLNGTLMRGDVKQPLTEINHATSTIGPFLSDHITGCEYDPSTKENNPGIMTEKCSQKMPSRQYPVQNATSRDSTFRLSTTRALLEAARLQPPNPLSFEREGVQGNHCVSPKIGRNSVRKIGGMLKKSFRKRTGQGVLKPPIRQSKGGINVSIDRVRVSIGSKVRLPRRVLLRNNDRGQKDKQVREKGRPNVGRLGRFVT